MLNICGNFFPILITLLACAGLFMYFNLRLAEIKVSVEKQNRVLTAFITNVQQDIKSGGGLLPVPSGMNHLAAPEAIIAAKKFEDDKIVVSDDEDSDDDDSDSDDDEGEGEGENVIQIVNLQEMKFEGHPIPISFEVLSCISSMEKPCETSSITEIIDITADADACTDISACTVPVPVPEATSADSLSYDQMKVDELRKIVNDKNLAPKEEVKKLKKPELLLLLKK